VEATKESIQQEIPKELVVFEADTVAYPGAVMVHPHDT